MLMIHDKVRVEAIRARVTARIALIKSLEAKVVEGKLDMLEVALNQTEDVENFFLQALGRSDRTPEEEARWLSQAEYTFEMWSDYLKQTEEQFSTYGDRIVVQYI